MTDQYLCRGKRLDGDHEWVEGCYVFAERHDRNGLEHFILEVSADGAQYEVDPATVGRCTGLRDSNGQMAFDNDIIRYFVDSSESIGVIRYGNCPDEGAGLRHIGFYVEWRRSNDGPIVSLLRCDLGYWLNDGNCRIVGNVTDNPELLGGGQDG